MPLGGRPPHLVQLEWQDGHPGIRDGAILLRRASSGHHWADPCNNAAPGCGVMLNAVAPSNGPDCRGRRLMAEPPERHEDQQAHAVATLARDQVGDRRDVVEVSMDLSRLV